MKKDELAKYLNQARGFLFPSLEPFGIAPVEALAAGCPVVAYGEGGAKDYVEDSKNGVLFPEQTPISLAEGILELEKLRLNRKAISKTADAFSLARFDQELVDFISHFEDQDLHESLLEIAERKRSSDIEQIIKHPQDTKRTKESDQTETKKAQTPDQPVHSGTAKVEPSATPQDTEISVTPEDAEAPFEKDEKATTSKSAETKPAKSSRKHSPKSKKTPKKDKKDQKTKKSTKTPESKKTKKQLQAAKIVKEALQDAKPKHAKSEQQKVTETPTSSRAFPKIGEDVERTRELVKKSEAAKETQRPAFPKIGEKS